MLDDQRGPGFKLLRGFRGQFLATYGDHTIRIWTNDRQHVLATKSSRSDRLRLNHESF
jgi:CYTH domain-containing protein